MDVNIISSCDVNDPAGLTLFYGGLTQRKVF